MVELLADADMLLMFKCSFCGGIISQAVHRDAKAGNKYTGYPEGERSFLQYLDANNLFGWAISQKLPTGGFNWVDASEFMPGKTDSFANCDSEGYLSEVHVKYPKELHDSHHDLPFICEKMAINRDEKLVPNLYDKNNCIIYARALNQALKHGLTLEKVHRVMEFNQSAWLKLTSISTQRLERRRRTISKKDSSSL